MLTLDEVRTELAPYDEVQEITLPMSQGGPTFSIEDTGLMVDVSGRKLSVGRDPMVQALGTIPGLSQSALTEWPTPMLLEPINWFMTNRPAQSVRLLVNEQDEVLAFPKKQTTFRSPLATLDGVLEALGGKGVDMSELQFDKFHAGLNAVSLAIIAPSREHEVKRKAGDIVQGGLWLHTSPVGNKDTEIAAYVNRLICTNGMISPMNLQRFSIRGGSGAGGDGWDNWIEQSASDAWEAVTDEFDALDALTGIAVDGHSADVLSDLFQRHRVPASLRSAVQEAMADEGDGTMYGIAQAFNRAANGLDDLGHMRHLLTVTGEIAHNTERCGECRRQLN